MPKRNSDYQELDELIDDHTRLFNENQILRSEIGRLNKINNEKESYYAEQNQRREGKAKN